MLTEESLNPTARRLESCLKKLDVVGLGPY